MLKTYVTLMLLLFTPKTQVLSLKQVDKVLDTSVLIRIKGFYTTEQGIEKPFMGGCSGTYIAEEKILTAAHCFEERVTNIWIRDYMGESHKTLLLKKDKQKDLALLLVEDLEEDHAFANIARHTRLGEQVVSVGTPFALEFLVSEGIVSKVDYKAREFTGRYLIHTGMINPGSSGGGAFNEQGELIGVNTMTVGGLFGWAGISMAVDSQTIKEFLQ